MRIIHVLPHSLELFAAQLHTEADWQKVEHHVVGFIRNLRQFGDQEYTHELWTVSSVHKKPFGVMHREGFAIRVFPRDFASFLPIETSVSMLREVRRVSGLGEVDYWHLHSYYLWMYDFLAVLLAWYKQPFLAHFRGGAPTWRSLPYSLYHFGLALPVTLRLAKKILVQNTREYARLRRRYKIRPEKIVLVPNCTSTTAEPRTPREHVPRLICVGRVIAYKGVWEILMLCRELQLQGNKFEIEIIGEGELLPVLKQEFAEPWAIFRGNISREQTVAALQRADVFVFGTTKTEGSPYALIEAQGMGLPAVAWRREGIEDVIVAGETGYLVESWQEFRARVQKLILNPQLRAQMATQAKQATAANFSCDTVVKTVLATYQEKLLSGVGDNQH